MYGIGSDFIPANIARPLKLLSNRMGSDTPFLDYAYGSLNNWKINNDVTPDIYTYNNDNLTPDKELPTQNLKLIRMFNGCQDEEGFMLVHVAIVAESYRQIRAYEQIFNGI